MKRIVTFALEEEQVAALEDLATKDERTLSGIMRLASKAYIKTRGGFIKPKTKTSKSKK
jgi:predicted transcriptional regulator